MKNDLRFGEAIKHMQNKLRETASIVGVFTEAEAKMRATVDTGHLRRSITHDTMINRDKGSVHVGTNVDYAPFVELGTVNMSSQPFIKPAIMENVSSIQSLIHKGLRV